MMTVLTVLGYRMHSERTPALRVHTCSYMCVLLYVCMRVQAFTHGREGVCKVGAQARTRREMATRDERGIEIVPILDARELCRQKACETRGPGHTQSPAERPAGTCCRRA